MDNFLSLINDLKSIIDNLDEKIQDKKGYKLELIATHHSDMERKKNIPYDIAIIDENIKYLKKLNKSKNIFLFTLGRCLKGLKEILLDFIKDEVTKKSLGFLGSAFLTIMICIICPYAGIGFIGLLIAIVLLGCIMATRDNKKFMKKYSIAAYEKEKEQLENELNLVLARINSYGKDINTLSKEIDSLKTKRLGYIRDLKEVKRKRHKVVERLVSEEVLNKEFQSEAFDDIIKRVREKKASEQLRKS